MTKSSGQIEIHLFPRGGQENFEEYHVGDYGDAKCDIDLKDYTIFVYKDKKIPLHRILILRPRKKQ